MNERVRQRRRGFIVVVGGWVIAAIATAVLPGGLAAPTAVTAATTATAAYVPVGPSRLADTRSTPCGCTRADASTIRVPVAGRDGVPDQIVAAAVTITATATGEPGYVTVYPGGRPRPTAATLNTRPDRNVSNSAIVPVGADGTLAIYQRVPGELVVDITGVFVAADDARAGRFVTVAANRLLDTREPGPAAGALPADGELTVPLPAGIPSDATAVVVNVASVGVNRPGHLAARPAGTPRRTTAFMTVSGTGQTVSNATIVPVSPDGFTIRSKSGGHVVIDVVGWFTGPSAAESTTGLYVPVGPERLHDTRLDGPRVWPGGTIEVPVAITGASSIVTNVAATQADRRGYVAAYAAGRPRPGTATLNPAFHDHTVANLAITQVSTRGLAYYALAGVDLVVDVTGYFTGSPVAATVAKPANAPLRSRVFIVGDSTLASLHVVPSSQSALIGFDAIVDGASCRRLLRPSCLSNTTGLTPNTAVEAIAGVPGRLDIVVVKAGYNDWFSDFPKEFDAVVRTARAKGAHTIVWMSYNQDVNRTNARRAYVENNIDLYRLARLPEYSDVLLADWWPYSRFRQDWFTDGTHANTSGAYAIADYISRWIAAVEHRPCPRPWNLGEAVPSPCPIPETVGPVPHPISLY